MKRNRSNPMTVVPISSVGRDPRPGGTTPKLPPGRAASGVVTFTQTSAKKKKIKENKENFFDRTKLPRGVTTHRFVIGAGR